MYTTLGLLLLCGLYIVSRFRPPEWKEELKFGWSRLNNMALGLSFVVTLTTLFFSEADTPGMLSLPVLIYLTAKSLVTDPALRLAYRHPFTIAIITTGVIHGIGMLRAGREDMLVIMLAFSMLFTALLMFPRMLAQGDTRAILLTVTAAFPVLPVTNLMTSLWISAGLLIAYALVSAIAISVKERRISALGLMFTKVSIPAVPIFIAPATAMLVVSLVR